MERKLLFFFTKVLQFMRYSGKIVIETERPQMAIQYGACTGLLITKATRARARKHTHTHIHSEFVVLTSFLREQLLHERNTVLRYMYMYVCIFPVLFSCPAIPSLFKPNPRVPYITEDCFWSTLKVTVYTFRAWLFLSFHTWWQFVSARETDAVERVSIFPTAQTTSKLPDCMFVPPH